ncbi:hypothetical protein ACIP6P_05445 [Streptomyces sp. NPDC088729]|uniref:hypothetical protein n=1 Tax=Streptomyces sp. NPDC088729 TaxID=3365876 RepID=UPI00380DF2B5
MKNYLTPVPGSSASKPTTVKYSSSKHQLLFEAEASKKHLSARGEGLISQDLDPGAHHLLDMEAALKEGAANLWARAGHTQWTRIVDSSGNGVLDNFDSLDIISKIHNRN